MKTAKEFWISKFPDAEKDWQKTGHDDNFQVRMMEEYAKYYHEQQVNSVDLADVVNWLPFNKENASHYNRLAKEGKLVKLYDTGEQRHVNDDNFPMAVVTHYREG